MAALATIDARRLGEVEVERQVFHDRLADAQRRVERIEHGGVTHRPREAEAQRVETILQAGDFTGQARDAGGPGVVAIVVALHRSDLLGIEQALKHRAAEMFVELELTRSIVLDALTAVDEERDDASLVVSAAKAIALASCCPSDVPTVIWLNLPEPFRSP